MDKINRIKDFVLSSEKIILLYHIDTDGVCSAKIVHEALKKMGKEIMDYFPTSPKLLKSKGFQKGIARDMPDLIICVDVALIENMDVFKHNPEAKFIVIDHHGIEPMYEGDNIVYYNPKLEGDNTFNPAAKLCHDIFSKVCKVGFDWVAATGIIGDAGGFQHKAFVEKVLKKHGYDFDKNDKYYFNTLLGKISEIINSGKVYKGNDGAQKALKIMEESPTPEEFMNKSTELQEWHNKINQYLEETSNDFEKRKEHYKNLELSFYIFSPKYMIGSVLATILSFKHPDTTIIIMSRKNGMTTINLRNHHKKVNMNELAKKAVRGLKSSGGGGHVPAAGAHIMTRDINLFKRNIVRIIKDLKQENP